MKFVIFLTVAFVSSIDCKTYEVYDAADFHDAMSSVNPGDTIHLNDGSYNAQFESSRSGSSDAPITLKGSRKAVISSSNYGVFIKGDYWHLEGFKVSNAKKGIMLEGASHCVLDNLEVSNIHEEGIHFRKSSQYNILRNSYVHDTGTVTPSFGEGVYIGQAVHNWADGKQDKSDHNQVLNNRIGPNVAAECIDIKEGSCCGTIKQNTFDGKGEKGENSGDSWVDIKGDKYDIEDNDGSNALKDGFQIHHIADAGMGGCDNKIINNRCSNLGSGGKCVANSVKDCSNTIQDNQG